MTNFNDWWCDVYTQQPAVSIDGADSKCLATADDDSHLTVANDDRDDVTTFDDDVTTPTNNDDNQERSAVDEARLALPPPPSFNVDDDYTVEKVIPVEANVVLVSRPGDHPHSAPDITLERSVAVGNTDNSRLTANATDDDNANDISCQSMRAPRRHRKRSSCCNNVDLDEVVVDVQPGQSDLLTTGRKTSVPHQRHADGAEREHRPKRKGTISVIYEL